MRRIWLGLLLLLLSPLLLLALPFLAVGALWDQWRRLQLRRQFAAKWEREGKCGLLVYSDSPHWKSYIEEHWLPKLESRLVVLNWSERKRWPTTHPLEAQIFRRYLGREDFNPAAVIFPGGAEVRIIRFWQPFRDYRHGRDRALRAAEAELFAFLDRGTP